MKTFFLILTFIGVAYGGALLGQNPNIKKSLKLEENVSRIEKGTEKAESILKDSQLKIKSKVKKIIKENSVTEETPIDKTDTNKIVENQWYYLYGTDAFDSEHNARCYVKKASKIEEKGVVSFKINQTCQGKKEHQKALQKLIQESLIATQK